MSMQSVKIYRYDTRKWHDSSHIAYSTITVILKSTWIFECLDVLCRMPSYFDLSKPKMPVVINNYQGVMCVTCTAHTTLKTHLRKVSTDSTFLWKIEPFKSLILMLYLVQDLDQLF